MFLSAPPTGPPRQSVLAVFTIIIGFPQSSPPPTYSTPTVSARAELTCPRQRGCTDSCYSNESTCHKPRHCCGFTALLHGNLTSGSGQTISILWTPFANLPQDSEESTRKSVCLQAKRTHGRIHGNSLKLHNNNMSYWIQERFFSILFQFCLVCLHTFC